MLSSFSRTLTKPTRTATEAVKVVHFSKRGICKRFFRAAASQPNPTFSRRANLKSTAFRKFYSSQAVQGRIFKDTENTFAYGILQTLPINDRKLFKVTAPKSVTASEELNDLLDRNWREKSATEIVEAFKSAATYCIEQNIDVSDPRFDKLTDGLMDRVQDLTDEELAELLVCLSEYPLCDTYTAHNFHDIWSALDDVCCWRLADWSNDRRFLFAELWYRMHLGKLSDYMFNFIDRMHKRLKFLSKEELIHIFFYLKIQKRQKIAFECYDALDERIGDMTLEEMYVAAAAMTRGATKIKLPSIAEAFIRRLKQDAKTADDLCVMRIVEVLRYSSHVLLVDQLMDLLDHLLPEIDRLSNLCCIHIALLGTTLQFFHEESLRKVCEKILKKCSDPKEVRLKDLERLLVPLTMFYYDPKTDPDIYAAIVSEIHTQARRMEFIKFVRCLPSILNLLSIRKLYSYELMDGLLDMDHILDRYGKSPKMLPRELLHLDVCTDIELPDYKGRRLEKSFRNKAAKWNVEYTPTWNQMRKINAADKFFLEIVDAVGRAVGKANVYVDHIIPSFVKSDIIVCRNKDGRFVKPQGFDAYSLGDVMRPPSTTLEWFAIVPLNWNHCIRNTFKPLGQFVMKSRLLEALGYKAILVQWNEFSPLKDEEKVQFIQKLLK